MNKDKFVVSVILFESLQFDEVDSVWLNGRKNYIKNILQLLSRSFRIRVNILHSKTRMTRMI